MKKTIISHFYNEEYLLPWFLHHHKKIFDHGVMIDYHSTDNSVNIIKEICPNWDIITSRNINFQADNVDLELNDIEQQIDGWKICLNTTEHLIGDYSVLNESPQQLLVPTIFFVDCDRDRLINKNIPIYEQKTYGFTFHDNFHERKARSLHNISVQYPIRNTNNCTGPGRHYTLYNTDKLAIFYYGWCPFDEGQIARKLQIQTQIPQSDKDKGWGFQHIVDKEKLINKLESYFIPKSRNIQQDIEQYVTAHRYLSNIL
jgi:hypothetical protein